jgi:hypothetical protein
MEIAAFLADSTLQKLVTSAWVDLGKTKSFPFGG